MKNEFLQEGRIQQKLKTRARILEVAQQLLVEERDISMEEVAQEADVSRATIYRYFPTIDLLSAEASLDIHHQSPGELCSQIEGEELSKQILFIQEYYNELAIDYELLFRRYLSAVLSQSITSKKKLRGARRVVALEHLLSSHTCSYSSEELEKLKNITAILTGIDALIVAKDVCHLSNDEAKATLEWGIKMILKGMKTTS